MDRIVNLIVGVGVGVVVGASFIKLIDDYKDIKNNETENVETFNYEEYLDEEDVENINAIKDSIKKDMRKEILLKTLFRIFILVIIPYMIIKRMQNNQEVALDVG